MSTHTHLPIFLSLCVFVLFHGFSYAQVEDSLSIEKDTLEANYEQILLNGKVFYQHKKTDKLINELGYLILCELGLEKKPINNGILGDDFCTDRWETDKVNPYRDVTLPSPFKIEFDQTSFTHPLDREVVVTSRFGRRRRGLHRGFDLDLITGDSVRAMMPGKVRFVGYSRGHGKTVIVRHANEIETLYAHLSGYNVKVNDIINEGEVIAFGGNTGRSTGSHLHLEVRYKGVCIHPEYVFNFDGSNTIRGKELWVTNMWKSPRVHSAYRQSKLVSLHTKEQAIAAQNAEPKYHRVRKGDTLSHIAQKYHVGLKKICSLNSISTTSILRIGQTIQVR